MLNVVNKWLRSFEYGKKGYSLMKVTGLILVCFAGYVHYVSDYSKTGLALSFLIVDTLGAFLCFGLVDFEDILDFKYGRQKDTTKAGDTGANTEVPKD